MKRVFLIISISTILISLTSCDWFTSPEELKPGRRDYVWTADTLEVPYGEYTSIFDIWGANSNDVWAISLGSSKDYRMWHYDGIEWTNYRPNFRITSPSAIWGTAEDNIWLGTAFGVIAHYDGTSWEMEGDYSTDEEVMKIEGMWGRSKMEIYTFGFLDRRDATGFRGFIMKYDGFQWNLLTIDTVQVNFLTMGYDKDSNKYFLSGRRDTFDIIDSIWRLDGHNLVKLYEGNELTNILVMDDRCYFRIGKKIYKYRNNDLSLWKDFSSDPIYAGLFAGRNERDLFLYVYWGLGHYDGDDVEMIYDTDLWLRGSLVLEHEVFFTGAEPVSGVDVILHGILN